MVGTLLSCPSRPSPTTRPTRSRSAICHANGAPLRAAVPA